MTNPADRIKSFGMTNMILEADLDRIEKRFDINLGRRREDELDEWEELLQSFDEALKSEASSMSEKYRVFYCLESSIRELVGDVLEADAKDEGGVWWDTKRVSIHVKDEVKKRMREERESGVTPRSSDPLDYTTFGELGQIIRENWVAFGSVLNDLKAVGKVMAQLNTLRGPIAHCSPLADDEVMRLKLTLRDWFRLLK